MNKRFTERAQKVMYFAELKARSYKSEVIGTEHLLWGILREEDGLGAKSLALLGVELDDLEEIMRDGESDEIEIGVSPLVKSALTLASQEARDMQVNYIGTEHLLLGLIREEEGLAASWLAERYDINEDNLRKAVFKSLQGFYENAGAPMPPTMTNDNANKGPVKSGNQGMKKKSNTPTLDKFGRDLTKLAEEEGIDPVVGRSKEIKRVIQILSRRTKNNPVLIGEPGVGKTAIVEGLARKVAEGKVPEMLRAKRVVVLDISSLLAGAKYRGEFEERLKKVMDEVRKTQEVILFIDELHTLVGAGSSEGSIDAANILKPALARGELQCVGATTTDEYRKYIEKDAALERRFQPVTVYEPSPEEAEEILFGIRDNYEAHHRVHITDEAIKAAVTLSHRYLMDRYLPDKAIDLIDEASSMVRLASYTAPADVKNLENELAEVQKEKEEAINLQEFERAAELRDDERALLDKVKRARKDWQKGKSDLGEGDVVTEEDIAKVLSDWSGVPVAKLKEADKEKLLNMEKILHERVIGQDDAVKSIAKAVRRSRAGLKDPNRPVGSFIFLGPTGVGKTELAKTLANTLFGSDDAFVRLDMSEYMEKHAVSRMIGSPPGYIGHDEGGQLTEAIRTRPYSVILLDEIEKAHPDVFNILLQVLEDGRLTDSQGRVVDFSNTVIIMTSNVGATSIYNDNVMGFDVGAEDEEHSDHKEMEGRIMERLRKTFRPEFLNRIDETIVFHSLTKEDIKQIADLMIKDLSKRLAEQELTIEITPKLLDKLVDEGWDEEFGARPLRRTILRMIEDPLSENLLKETFVAGDHIVADLKDNKANFYKKADHKTKEKEVVE